MTYLPHRRKAFRNVSDPNFVIVVKTDNPGTSNNNQMSLPISGTNIDIDWGDGTLETIGSASYATPTIHTYGVLGTYTIKMGIGITRINFGNTGDCQKLIEVSNCGDAIWTSFSNAFYGCSNLTTWSATDSFNLSLVTSFSSMFRSCSSLTTVNVSNWDTSNITAFYYMFYGCSSFTTLDVSNWCTSSGTNMSRMFGVCTIQTLDVSKWDTSSVISMSEMFNLASQLTNLDVSSWDTSACTNMYRLFRSCSKLTSLDVLNWNTSSVTTMGYMFESDSSLSDLDVSNFNISALNTTSSLNNFLSGVTLTTAVYDAVLIDFAAQTVFTGMSPNFGLSKYTPGGAAEAARTSLINDDGWTITDGGPA